MGKKLAVCARDEPRELLVRDITDLFRSDRLTNSDLSGNHLCNA